MVVMGSSTIVSAAGVQGIDATKGMAWLLDQLCQIRSLLAKSSWRGGPILGENLQDAGLAPIGEVQGDDVKSGDPKLRAIQKGMILIVHEVRCDALKDLTILIHQRLPLQLQIVEGIMPC
jgi:hypothetical protein